MLLNSGQICQEALRLVGSHAIHDAGADGVEIGAALTWLDLTVGHLVATRACLWLRPASVTLTTTANVGSYQLTTALDATANDIQHVVGIWYVSNNVRTPLNRLSRDEYEERKGNPESGVPTSAYIDRREVPTLFLYPVPASAVSLLIEVQTWAPDQKKASQAHGMREAWQLFLIKRLAWELGGGIIARLPPAERADLKREADMALYELDAFDERERLGSRLAEPNAMA